LKYTISCNNLFHVEYYEKKVQTLAVNNSHNINKANKQPPTPQNIERKKFTTYGVGYKSSVLGQTQKCGGVKPVYLIPTPSITFLSNNNTDVNNVL
jgi:hypothetical protein